MSGRRDALPIESYRKRWTQLAYRPRYAFFEPAHLVVGDERTVLRYDRLYVLSRAANLKNVAGAAAQIGSYREVLHVFNTSEPSGLPCGAAGSTSIVPHARSSALVPRKGG